MANRRVAFDFDGTIAEWRSGSVPNYKNPDATMKDCYSNPALRWIALQLRMVGVQLFIITGRDERHRDVLHRWLQFYGIPAQIHCRPNHTGLSCQEQALWKASVLKALEPIMFVGDNPSIDEAAARKAGIAYVHVDRAAAAVEKVRCPHDSLKTEQSRIQNLLELLL